MSDHYTLHLSGMDTLERALAEAPDVLDQEMRRFFAWATTLLQGEVQDRTPAAEGHLRNSIIGRTEISPSGMLGVIGTPLDYAPAVELGTKPHPVSEAGILSIAQWAMRKLPLGQAVSLKTGKPLKNKGVEESALAAAHAIAWKIKRYGTQGAFMFRDAFAANSARVVAQWETMLRRVIERLGGGA